MSICDSSHSDQSDTSGISSSGFGHTRTASLSSGCGISAKVSLSPELRRTKEPNNISVSSDTTSSATTTEISRNAANHMSCPDLETMVARAGGLHAVGGLNISGGIPLHFLKLNVTITQHSDIRSPQGKND